MAEHKTWLWCQKLPWTLIRVVYSGNCLVLAGQLRRLNNPASVCSMPTVDPVLCCKGATVLHLRLPRAGSPLSGVIPLANIHHLCCPWGNSFYLGQRQTWLLGFFPCPWKPANKKNEAVMNEEGCKSNCVILLSPERQKRGACNLPSVVAAALITELLICDISVSVIYALQLSELFPFDIWNVNNKSLKHNYWTSAPRLDRGLACSGTHQQYKCLH